MKIVYDAIRGFPVLACVRGIAAAAALFLLWDRQSRATTFRWEDGDTSQEQSDSGRGHGEKSASEGSRNVTWEYETEADVARIVKSASDLSSATTLRIIPVRADPIPDVLLERMSVFGRKIESLSIGRPQEGSHKSMPSISDTGMKRISKLPILRELYLACDFSPEGFAELSSLTELKWLGVCSPTVTAAQFFAVVAEMRKINSLVVMHADFSSPIDEETFQAIASLNGRLEFLDFGEWGETKIHVEMIPAIAKVESLHWLELGDFVATYEQCDPIRHHLAYLDHLGPHVRQLADIPTTQQCSWKAASPIQASTVRVPAEMQRLLRAILGTLPANAVRKEVVRRRAAGQTELVDYIASPRPLPEILHDSFGIDLNPKATETFQAIARDNPNLDLAIRRFLSGRKELGASSSHDR